MYCTKIVGLFLFLSFQTYGMLMVNQLPKKIVLSAEEIYFKNCRIEAAISKTNYEFNELFFQNKMIPDMQPVVMNNLDHRSNIQFIQTCKYLYDRYAPRQLNGVRHYNNCLFTLHPFDAADYTKAMFHYASKDEEKVKFLMGIGGDVQKDREDILKRCGVDHSDENAVIGFYKQDFSLESLRLILGNVGLLTRLLKQGLSSNCQENKVRNSLLHIVAFDNNIEVLNILLADPRTNPNIQNSEGLTAVLLAVANNRVEILQILLADLRTNPNVQGRDGISPLLCAVGQNKPEALRVLLSDPRTDPNMPHRNGTSPLMFAAERNNTEALKILLADQRTNPNASLNGITALILFANSNNVDGLMILLANPRTDPNVLSPGGMTALMAAASLNNMRMLNLLIADHRVDHSIQDKDGLTALMFATVLNNLEASKALSECKNLEAGKVLSEQQSFYDKCSLM